MKMLTYPKKAAWLAVLFILAGLRLAWCQQVDINGTVTDSTGLPLPGVSVQVKGASTGTNTNLEGQYSLQASPGQVLQFSMVGYEPAERTVGDNTSINVALHPVNYQLDDVVVLGYQTTSRKNVTTSIASVSSDEIKSYVTGTPADAIQGKLPGVQVMANAGTVGAQPRILVRGLSSLTAGTNPLIIVDGMEVGYNFMSTINPNDIERIDVLKDASAAAIYGSRGGQGVILITTKRGTGEPAIQVESSVGMDLIPDIAVADASEYMRVQNQIAENSDAPLPFRDPGRISGTDYWGMVHTPGTRQNHQISVTGGKEGLSLFGSVNYYQQSSYNGNRAGKWDKLTARLNADIDISKVFKAGLNLAPRYEKYPYAPVNLTGSAMRMDPTTPPLKSVDSVFYDLPDDYDQTAFNPYYSQPNRSPYNQVTSPEFNLRTNFSENEYFGALYAAYLEIRPVDNLLIKTTLDGSANVTQSNSYSPKYYLAPNARSDPWETITNSSTSANTRWKVTNTVNYKTQLKDHHLDVMLGHSMDSYTQKGTSAQRRGIPFDEDPYRYIPAAGPENSGSGSYQPGAGPFGKMLSFFGSLRYSFNEKYHFSGTMRADASSLVNPEYQWGYFPTLSGAWIVSDEPFFEPLDPVLSFLKLRVSWGKSGGNLPGQPGSYLTVVNQTTYVDADGNALAGYVPTWISNPEIKWEVQEDYTAGLEAAFFNNRLNLTLERYIKTPDNLRVSVLIDHTLGYPNGYTSYQPANVARLRTNGWDVGLSYQDRIAGKVNFGADLTLSHFKSTVKHAGNVDPLLYGEQNDVITTFRSRTTKGEEPGAWFGLIAEGVFQTDEEAEAYVNSSGERLQPQATAGDLKFRDHNGDGEIDNNDLTNIGSPWPDLTSGLTLTFGYHGFDLRTEFYGVFGAQNFNNYRLNMNPARGFSNFMSGFADQFWNGEGSTNEFPVLRTTDLNGNFSRMSTFFLEKGDFIRCRVMQLGYTLPPGTVKGVKNLRIHASVQNLFTITGYSGLNPDVPWYSGIGYNSVDNYQAVLPRTWLLGVSMNL